jgi:glutathione S-transferase
MTNPILHEYPGSPFSEKIRAIFGYKAMSYQSVNIPVIMPKPDLMPLTGGYRRTPVMQIGANVYCDTRLITQIIEKLQPTPCLYPANQNATVNILAQWADQHLFSISVALCFSPAGLQAFAAAMPKAVSQAFAADRKAMRKMGISNPIHPDVAYSHMQVYLDQLNNQLTVEPSQEGSFIFGKEPTIADFSVYHCLWFVQRNAGVSAILKPYAAVMAWMQRIKDFGHGRVESISGETAINIAKDSDINEPENTTVSFVGFSKGDRVTVVGTDLGIDPVEGSLVAAHGDEIIIRRQEDNVGELLVHFPTIGYHLAAVE